MSQSSSKSTKPNVLILMCDQMQAYRMGFVDGIAHTPNLDALARQSAHFTQAITVHGQCAPSRCAFVTGQSPHQANVMCNVGFHGHQAHLTPDMRTFFHEFQDAGYTTAHFGKSHLGSPLSLMGFDHGECLDGNFPEGTEPDYRKQRRAELAAQGETFVEGAHPGESTHYKYLRDGLAFLNQYEPGDDPLLFMYDTNLPHPPFYWEDEWKDMFRPEDMVLPESMEKETWENKPDFLVKHAKDGPHKLKSEAKLREEMAQYYTMIAALDKACGQIIDAFKAKGLWDNTLVLFTSDHGDMMGGHGMTRKGCIPYEELYNVPLLIRQPHGHITNRSTIDDVVISTDIGGALLRLAGIEPSDRYLGKDGSGVVGALQRDQAPEDNHVFFEHYAAWWGVHPFYGVRTQTMKYVRYYGPDDTEEMYDLAADPHELTNLAHDPAHAATKARLAKLADDWWQSTNGQPAEYYASDQFKANLNA